MGGLLKLRAADADDLAVMAACLQDALVPIGDIAFLPQERRFVLVANRFRWEAGGQADSAPDRPATEEGGDVPYEDDGAPTYERTNCGVWFEDVTSVRTKGIDLKDRGRILELLTLQAAEGSVTLVFAGNAMIRLEIDRLRCFLEDIGQAWPTRWRPSHPFETEESS